MTKVFGGIILIIVALSAWRVASIISPDAISMAVGMLFGVVAGIPTALLMLAGNRRDSYRRDYSDEEREAFGMPPRQQPPVVIVMRDQPQERQTFNLVKGMPPLDSPAGKWEYVYRTVDDDELLEW